MFLPLRFFFPVLLLISGGLSAQSFYLGADLSYVNEMEDCGAVYQEDKQPKDPYAIFSDHGSQLVRLRLWHTPSWYDALNEGRRYSDLADVSRSIQRAKAQGMRVLLDFHLSDNWADPGKQVIPQAWRTVVNNLPLLKDSLYNYIHQTLTVLNDEGLLPGMVQIGNETNKGILLSQEVNDAGWTLDWDRNSQLFNAAIQAVRAVETASGQDIKIVIHAAGPDGAGWIFDEFIKQGVTDFDIMGISYYWAWHKPADMAEVSQLIETLRTKHPRYEVMIVETGYIWTTAAQDAANNIISEVHPDYSPASPDAQRRWLIDLTKAVLTAGGAGVLYWEPAWVSTGCSTQWGKGSHQEHATFFGFDHNLLPEGGIAWLSYDYGMTTDSKVQNQINNSIRVFTDSSHRVLNLVWTKSLNFKEAMIRLTSSAGKVVLSQKVGAADRSQSYQLSLPSLPSGVYVVSMGQKGRVWAVEKVLIDQD